MGYFDDMNELFGSITKRELTEVEKVQVVEGILREGLRDLAFSRDEIYSQALQERTTFMVRQGEEKLKKFKSNESMYISIPASIYEDIKDMDDFDQYHHVLDTAMLTMAADEYREIDEDGNTILEAELVDKAVKKIEEYTGDVLPIAEEIEYDDYGSAEKLKDDKTLFEPKKFTKVKADNSEEEEEDEDDKAAKEAPKYEEGSGTSSTGGTVNMQSIQDDVEQEKQENAQILEQQYSARYTSQSITNTEQKVVDDLKSSTFYYGHYGNGENSILSPKTKVELNKYVNDIAKALRGYNGKIKRLNPAKRLSAKDICNDISDKIYIGKSYVDGKFIDQNIVVDCSGSMGGDPIRDAIKLCYVFNKLAQEGLLEGKIILTESSENKCLTMPVHDDIISVLGGTGGGEGLTKTLLQYKSEIRGKNVIVMTDGDLVEEPIPDKFWDEGRMTCVGMYINRSVKAENLPGYDRGMARWFPKTIIRNSFHEAVQKLIQLGLKASKK